MEIDLFKLIDVTFEELKSDDEYNYLIKFNGKDITVPKALCGLDEEEKTATMPEWAAALLKVV
jgi:hypothetical protein